jgi:hypothetical protein
MSTDTIFNNGNPATPEATPAPSASPYDNLLGMIVNEQGEQKYKSVDEALKGAAHAQAYIQKVQQEKAALEAELNAARASSSKEAELERTLQELLAKQGQPAAPTPAASVNPDDVASLVMKQIEARNAETAAKANQTSVATAFVEKFGAEAEAKYNAAAQELGLTVAELNAMAAKSPKAVLKAIGFADTQATRLNTGAPAANAIRTEGFTPTQETLVKRNTEQLAIGATTRQINEESRRSKAMVEELHAQGHEVGDLSDPKVFFKYFK